MKGLHSLKCAGCLQQFNVEYNGVPVTRLHYNRASGVPSYCPYCGSKDVDVRKEDAYWQDLAEGLGLTRDKAGVDLIKQLYDLWPTAEYVRFRDFVEHEMEELVD